MNKKRLKELLELWKYNRQANRSGYNGPPQAKIYDDAYIIEQVLVAILEEEKQKCDNCGKEKPDVSYRPNAYAQDVHNDSNAYWTACDDCAEQNALDI